LEPDNRYELRIGNSSGWSRTLPAALDRLPAPFGVALGSCFYGDKDPAAAGFYQPRINNLYDVGLRFLCGDQLYMDLQGHVTMWKILKQVVLPHAPDAWARYREHWHVDYYARFLTQSPTLLLGDDHDFWNDFPHRKAWIPWGDPDPASDIRRTLDRAYSTYQAALNVDPEAGANVGSLAELERLLNDSARSFSFRVPPLEFFVLDVRTHRTTHDALPRRLCDEVHLQTAERWLAGLQGPGVLVLSQPLVVHAASWFENAVPVAKGDWNLPDYPEHFGRLCDALFTAPHDVMVLTGDIHWSRLYQLDQPRGGTVYEVVSSPLCLITGQSPPSLKRTKSTGKLEWRSTTGVGRKVDWKRLAAPTPESATYATARFSSLPGGVRADIEFWGRRGGTVTQPRRQLKADPITLH